MKSVTDRWFVPFLLLAALGARAAAAEPKKSASTKPVAIVLKLHGSLTETPAGQSFSLSGEKSVSLKDIVERLKKAADDEAIKAVVMNADGAELGTPQVEELRQAMAQFRAKGKEIYACADGLTMKSYALLSGATRLSVVPTGDLWLTGLYGESPFIRGLLKRLGVTPDFLTCGDYKSAAEMYMREGPSPQAEEMQNWLMDGIYAAYVKMIAAGRGVDEAKVRTWIDGGPYTAAKAKELGLIDAVEHREDFADFVKEKLGDQVKFNHKYGEKKQPELDLSSPFGVLNLWAELLEGPKKKTYKTSVAIVYVDGPITLGDSETSLLNAAEQSAASTSLRKALDKAADDDTIKAVVLRVNSPGGSATASEIILKATERVQAKKPLVVSMGDVAASGGYYVTCASDTIFADESTITGSIGVVGGKMATSELWDKFGIHWKAYQRGANASILSSAQAFTPEQRERMQAWMDEIYGVFKGHVVEARGDKLKKPIDELAGGRVYTGQQALELGLVDKIGTLADAVKFAAERAKLDKYEVRVVPEPKNFLETLMEDVEGQKEDGKHISLDAVVRRGGGGASLVDAALPYLKQLDPQRLKAVLLALKRLEMIQTEGAVLMAPEFVVGP
ncbi:MAG TPA: signal peptide peptidase SppA [Pirellulales bacterium]|nr:signal peptide peptidase SppA [Pirellulales bacterium]